MYSKNEEDNKLIKDLIEKRDDLKSKKKQIYLERETSTWGVNIF